MTRTRKGPQPLNPDEDPKASTTLESLAQLRSVFRKDGSVTAGNSSGINDGAATLVLARASIAQVRRRQARARIVSWGHAGIEPSLMGIGPVAAVPIALKRAGLSLNQIDVIQANEAFASQTCAVIQEPKLDPARTNIDGSGIALGHPVVATGAIITVKLLHELERSGGRYGLATMCIGGGQGIALIFERLPCDLLEN